MQNNDSSQGSTTPFYGPVFIGPGLKLNKGILSLAASSPATIYVHNIKLTTYACSAERVGQNMTELAQIDCSFYTSEGFFGEGNPGALQFWSYIVGNNKWTPTINGTLKMEGSSIYTPIVTILKETIEGTDYMCLISKDDMGADVKYYVTETDMANPSKSSIVDGFREV